MAGRFDANGVAVISRGKADKRVTHAQLARVVATLLENDARLNENQVSLLASNQQLAERVAELEAKLGGPV